MNRDPTMVGRSRVSAELIGEVVNGFFEPISWKTMVWMLSTPLLFSTHNADARACLVLYGLVSRVPDIVHQLFAVSISIKASTIIQRTQLAPSTVVPYTSTARTLRVSV